jgi:hypothetical protein
MRRMNSTSRGLRPTVGLRRPGDPICVGEGRRPARSALEGRFQSAQQPSADDRPAPTGRSHLRRRRPTPGAQAPWKADFNRREGLRPAVGPMRRMNSTFEGLRPTVGLRRPGDPICVGKGRRPARKRLGRPISIGATAFGRRPACAGQKNGRCQPPGSPTGERLACIGSGPSS